MASLVVFSVQVSRMATFYEAVLDLAPTVEPSGDIRLVGDGEEVLIHSIPDRIARTIVISSPPVARESSAIKPAFAVGSLASALQAVEATGGVVIDRAFTLDGLTRHDVLDPDGNVIQLRSPVVHPG